MFHYINEIIDGNKESPISNHRLLILQTSFFFQCKTSSVEANIIRYILLCFALLLDLTFILTLYCFSKVWDKFQNIPYITSSLLVRYLLHWRCVLYECYKVYKAISEAIIPVCMVSKISFQQY